MRCQNAAGAIDEMTLGFVFVLCQAHQLEDQDGRGEKREHPGERTRLHAYRVQSVVVEGAFGHGRNSWCGDQGDHRLSAASIASK